MIDQRTSMGALGDMNRFLQYQTGQAIGNVGQGGGGGGGIAETGAGLGAGLAVGGAMAGILTQSMQAAQQGQQAAQQGQGQAPAQANPTTPQEVQALLDNLDAQLMAGHLSEATYNTLRQRWEQRLQQMGGK